MRNIKEITRTILGIALGLYMLTLIVTVPYFNWQYVQEHGFVSWFFLGGIVATAKGLAWPYFVTTDFSTVEQKVEKKNNVPLVEETPPREFVDHQYQFAFQFPADWKLEKNPSPGEAGGVRVIVRHPVKPMYVTATVGHLGRTFTKQQFESSPNRDTMVESMMELTVEQVYKKTNQVMSAEQMIVAEKQVLPSDASFGFYISTAHITGNVTILMAGIHRVPFEKPYMVSFILTTPVDPTATKDNETITRVFNSFHIIGESAMK